jgi:conjugation system TraG family ATPase
LCKQIQQETGGKDGVYYTYKEDNPIRFNPFYVADKRYTTEKREQLSNLIFVLWKGNHPYSKTEETHVSTAINNYIDKRILEKGEVPSFNGFYDFLCDTKDGMKAYVNEEKIRIENFDIDDLCQVLKPYYKGGTYDYLLNATENIDLLDKKFIVFEIDNIKDHPTLFPVVTLVLMDTFLTKMRHPSIAKERKMILIEEAWKAISREGTAEFIKYLYKTVRKHFGEAIVVTQEVDDIIGNPIVKEAIISNADCKILLDQRKYQNKFDIVQQVLALSDKEKAIALSVNKDIHLKGRAPYKEVFITLNGNHTAVYAVEVSRQEYLTYTTEKKEKVKLYELEAKYGSMQKAIEMYIKNEKN